MWKLVPKLLLRINEHSGALVLRKLSGAVGHGSFVYRKLDLCARLNDCLGLLIMRGYQIQPPTTLYYHGGNTAGTLKHSLGPQNSSSGPVIYVKKYSVIMDYIAHFSINEHWKANIFVYVFVCMFSAKEWCWNFKMVVWVLEFYCPVSYFILWFIDHPHKYKITKKDCILFSLYKTVQYLWIHLAVWLKC